MAKSKAGGRNANLSPRVSAVRVLPKLGKWGVKELPDGTKRRVLIEHQDFATHAVVIALVAGGWNLPASDFDREFALHALSTDLYHVVTHYLSAAHYRQKPKEFRLEAKAFHEWLEEGLEAKFPRPESALAGALDDELEKSALDAAADIELCRAVILTLFEASGRIRADEAGAGKDADREKHEFFRGLATIYWERTGQRPTQVPDGDEDPFADFVAAVNKQIPKGYRLSGIIHLTRTYLAGR